MNDDVRTAAETAPTETAIRYKADAVIDALDEFLIAPSPSRKTAAMAAVHAYLAEADRIAAADNGMPR